MSGTRRLVGGRRRRVRGWRRDHRVRAAGRLLASARAARAPRGTGSSFRVRVAMGTAPLFEPLVLVGRPRPEWLPPLPKLLQAADLSRLDVSFRSGEDGGVYRLPLAQAGSLPFESALPSRRPPA